MHERMPETPLQRFDASRHRGGRQAERAPCRQEAPASVHFQEEAQIIPWQSRALHAACSVSRDRFSFTQISFAFLALEGLGLVANSEDMEIAILGAGAIGSTFAYHLAKAGHAVTVIARGARLLQLRTDNAIVLVTGESAAVHVDAALDKTRPYDLVLVTVLAPQVEAVLPSLRDCAAKTVMFMFNTFEPLTRLREAVGAERFAFGFPSVIANIVEGGQLTSAIVTRGALSPVTDAVWGKVFTDAGIPCFVEADMESWLRTHAAVVVPVMTIGVVAHARKAGVSWAEARQSARAMNEGFQLVRRLGHSLTPSAIAVFSHLPSFLVTTLLWVASRFNLFRKMGAVGPREPRALIDEMSAVAPGQTLALLAIRP